MSEDNIVEKYKERIYEDLYGKESKLPKEKKLATEEYKAFKKEFLPKPLGFYEKACNYSEKLLKIKASQKDAAEISESVSICHLEVTPSGVLGLSYIAPLILFVFGTLIMYMLSGALNFFLIKANAILV